MQCPDRADGFYRVEFADGQSVEVTFDELSLRRREIDVQLAERHVDYRPFIAYRCQVGSKAFGLDTEQSDDDIRGFFVPPADLHWSLYAVPEQLECNEGCDEVFWEIEKFVRLCLKANPNVLETLWSPMVIEANETAENLLAIRSSFLSKHLYKTYSGYVLSQGNRTFNGPETPRKWHRGQCHPIRLLAVCRECCL